MKIRILRGGRAVDGIAADDRGLAYGDGVFETLLVHEGRSVWWDAHWRRLRQGAERLRIALPDANPALYLTAALGITFPFNLIVGIPLFYWLAQLVGG